MLFIFNILIECLYYLFIALFIKHFNNFSMITCAWILLIFSIFLNIIAISLIYFLKNRKTYFIMYSLLIIFLCSIFYIFGKSFLSIFYIKQGLINFTMHLYKILFMFSPLLCIYFLGIHKLTYNQQKKQLYLTIALRRIILISMILITMNFLNFSNILYIISIAELILNILPFILNKKLHLFDFFIK